MSALLIPMLFANAFQKKKKRKKHYNMKTVKRKKISQNICRICNVEDGDIPIFDNFIQPNISEEIQHFSGVSITVADELSKYICQECLDLLNGCIKFREMCRRNNQTIMIEVPKKVIKTEYTSDHQNDNHDPNVDSDNSFSIPSPTFSENKSEIRRCVSCSKEFNDMKVYHMHLSECKFQPCEAPKPMEELSKKKCFLCDVCGKTTCSNANLLIHKVTHENVFPFKCDVCPYQGRTGELLKVHQRSHLTDKPYKCSQCPKTASTASNLTKHMRHVHSTTRPYKCTYCEKGFTYQHAMRRHIRDIHLRQGTAECNLCFKTFNTKKILQGHKLKVHKVKSDRLGRLPSYLQYQMMDESE